MTDIDYQKPLPEPTLDSQPYWDSLQDHKLKLQKCSDCGKIRHYPRPVCDACFSMKTDWVEASGKGKVFSWTISYHPFHVGFKEDIPYILVTVDLDEGVRLISQLKGGKAEEMKTGMPVEIFYDDVSEGITLPMFQLQK
jgi:uncharacterized OB-fold protein